MSNVMSEARADMSTPTKLAPETIKIRDALIEKFSDKPIEDLNIFIDDALIVEKDEFKRLGLLAARVHILRQRVLTLKAFNRDDTMDKIPSVQLAPPGDQFLDPNISIEDDHHEENDNITEWQTLKMIEPGEVNGVRFFKGTIIDASAKDADRLISSGKAIVVDNDGNPADTDVTTPDEITDTEVTKTGVADDGMTETGVADDATPDEMTETEVKKTGVAEDEMTADDNLSVNNEETNK